MSNEDKDIKVSRHAISKFIQISKKKYSKYIDTPKQAEINILYIYENSKKEEIHPGLIRRIIDNNFQEVDYYIYEEGNEHWRIVVGADNSIVTIEDMYLGKRRNSIEGRIRYKGKLWAKHRNKRRKNKRINKK